jgi:hypothetical protein
MAKTEPTMAMCGRWQRAPNGALVPRGSGLQTRINLDRPEWTVLQRRQEAAMRFRATVLQTGKTTTGIEVPAEIVEALGRGKRPAVTVAINGYAYRNTVAVMGGVYMIGISAEHRAGTGVKGGDEIDVDIELDAAPRVIEVPDDFAAALDAEPAARRTFDALSYSNKSWHTLQIAGAKAHETRQRRISKSIDTLREGRPR